MLEKRNEIKKNLLCGIIYLVGMISISISNAFGGYYCFGAAICTILLTVFLYNLFDKGETLKENIINLVAASTITVLEIIFCVVNDIFRVEIYTKANLGFWGVVAICSQIISALSIAYVAIRIMLTLKSKSQVELIDQHEEKTKDIEVQKENVKENIPRETNEFTEEIKSIPNSVTSSKEAPFMEEER